MKKNQPSEEKEKKKTKPNQPTLWVYAQKVFPCPNEDFPYISNDLLITDVQAAIIAFAAKV